MSNPIYRSVFMAPGWSVVACGSGTYRVVILPMQEFVSDGQWQDFMNPPVIFESSKVRISPPNAAGELAALLFFMSCPG